MSTLLQKALTTSGTKLGGSVAIREADLNELGELVDGYCSGHITATAFMTSLDADGLGKCNPSTRAQTMVCQALRRLHAEGWRLTRPQ